MKLFYGPDQNGQGITEKITNILKSIGINSNKIKNARRLRPKEGSTTHPVFVQMIDEGSRNLVIREAKRLRGVHGMQSVFIKPDLTEAERALEKQLRQRRDELNREESEQSSLFRWSIPKSEIRRYRQDIAKVRAANEPNERFNTKPIVGANGTPTRGSKSQQAERASNY